MTTTRPRLVDQMNYNGPVGDGPDGWTVTVVEPDPLSRMRFAFDGRDPGEGPFYVLRHRGSLWMSDTRAERIDHLDPVLQVRRAGADARTLIHGLGLGLVVAAALREGAAHVDVVELDEALIGWMEPWLQEVADTYGGTLTVHHGDALTYDWPTGTRWDVAWHDIWPDMNEDNLPEMHRLHRRFGRRVGWQGSWGRDRIEYERRRTRDAWWR